MQKYFKKIHQLLTNERTHLIEEIRGIELEVAGGSLRTTSAFGQKAEASEAYTEIERRSINSGSLRVRLREVEEALRKLDAGTYGVCDNCGGTIPAERLEVMPHTTHCVSCKTKIQQPHQNTSLNQDSVLI